MMMCRQCSRRQFLAGVTAVATTVPTIIPRHVLGADAPSKRITLGCIGMGSQGTNLNLK